ncbi:MAG: sensor histidine kinase, partial [Devosia sp.]|nr:sensor histidine kinase [Devosia sp.]
AFEFALAGAIDQSGQQAERRLALFDRTLEAIIERFHFLPATVALAPEARGILLEPADPAARETANGYLSRLNETAGAGELFVLSTEGDVLAASNWWAYDSLIGRDLSFRPYFEEALRTGEARFYAVGVATAVAGYFLAERIQGPDGPIGVAVAKINLGEIEANWWRSGELIAIFDHNDIAILSTRPDWRYRPLLRLDPHEQTRVQSERLYGRTNLDAPHIVTDTWPSRGTQFALLTAQDPEASGIFLLHELRLPRHNWRLNSFTPLQPLLRDAWLAGTAAALAVAALLLILALMAQHRRNTMLRLDDHEQLEQRVAERTEAVHIANEALRAEIAERIHAERAQAEAQAGLVQAAKLASLGQALAGVAHEVSQPVAALTTHLASAKLLAGKRGDSEIVAVLTTMDKVVDRLKALTGHLKTFSRKQTQAPAAAELAVVIGDALELVDHKLRAGGVEIMYQPPARPLLVAANAVHLEQVLINLFDNAADAMEGAPIRMLSIGVNAEGREVEVAVSDSGSGIAESELGNLFDPFYSTKEVGRGLGLGLAISYGLVREIGGSIGVRSSLGQGSTFTVRLPLASVPTIERLSA